jgi:single-stranded DNA-binding protein
MNYGRFIAIGNATKDAELRKATQGDAVFTTFTLAVNKAQASANFYSVIIFGPTAESAANLIKKGDAVLVDGTINLRPIRPNCVNKESTSRSKPTNG